MRNKIIGLFLTDTHIKEDNFELVFNIFKQAIDFCKKNNIKSIFHGGYFFTNRISQKLNVLLYSSKIFDLFFLIL